MRVLTSRTGFADLCNDLGIGVAVEVGTNRGLFAAAFLRRFNGTLYCVDPYLPYPGDGQLEPRTREPDGTRDRAADLRSARRALEPFGDRAGIVVAGSVETATGPAKDWGAGLVYLDGDHRYEAVAADIDAWWPLLPPGGILAGHDWDCPAWEDGIRRAVRERLGEPELAGPFGVDPASWWVMKGAPGPS